MYPTLGEFTKKVFNLTGALPSGGEKNPIFSEKDKKTLQTTLRRLANEDGNLLHNFNKVMLSFRTILASVSPNEKTQAACEEIISELANLYCEVLLSEPTYLTKKGTNKLILERYLSLIHI